MLVIRSSIKVGATSFSLSIVLCYISGWNSESIGIRISFKEGPRSILNMGNWLEISAETSQFLKVAPFRAYSFILKWKKFGFHGAWHFSMWFCISFSISIDIVSDEQGTVHQIKILDHKNPLKAFNLNHFSLRPNPNPVPTFCRHFHCCI